MPTRGCAENGTLMQRSANSAGGKWLGWQQSPSPSQALSQKHRLALMNRLVSELGHKVPSGQLSPHTSLSLNVGQMSSRSGGGESASSCSEDGAEGSSSCHSPRSVEYKVVETRFDAFFVADEAGSVVRWVAVSFGRRLFPPEPE